MNLELIRRSLSEITHILPIDRFALLNGVMCSFMGLTFNTNGTLSLLWLEYDEQYREKLEEAELAPPEAEPKIFTNRMKLLGGRSIEPRNGLENVRTVSFGGKEFSSRSGGGSLVGGGSWEKAALFTRFMLSDWKAEGFEWPDMDYVYLKHVDIDGHFDRIPDIAPAAPISFGCFGGIRRSHPQIPVTLVVDGEKQSLSFDMDGEEIAVTIEQVSLLDMYNECEKKLDSIKDRLSAEDLSEQRKAVFGMLEENCPRGDMFAAVEYTAPEGVSLQFHSCAWLDRVPVHRGGNRSGIFMVKSDSGNKCAVIQESFAPDTKEIKAELITCTVMEKPFTVTI